MLTCGVAPTMSPMVNRLPFNSHMRSKIAMLFSMQNLEKSAACFSGMFAHFSAGEKGLIYGAQNVAPSRL